MKTKIGLNTQIEIGLDVDDGYYMVTTKVGARIESRIFPDRLEAICFYCTQVRWYTGKPITPEEVSRQLGI